MTDLSVYRERAIRAVNAEFSLLNDEKLDDLAREILDLPDRPDGDIPFVGWLVEQPEAVQPKLTISQAGIDFIKRWEGFRARAYLCPAGVWTIGYGHTKTARSGQIINEVGAEELLEEDLKIYEAAVNYQVKVSLTQNQFDALVSFAFNCGTGALQHSTLLRKLNQGNYHATANEFRKWVRAGGKILPGLVNRREQERGMFLTQKVQ